MNQSTRRVKYRLTDFGKGVLEGAAATIIGLGLIYFVWNFLDLIPGGAQ